MAGNNKNLDQKLMKKKQNNIFLKKSMYPRAGSLRRRTRSTDP